MNMVEKVARAIYAQEDANDCKRDPGSTDGLIWFCVYCNGQSEATADQHLRDAGYETLFLRYQGTVRHAGRETAKILPVYPRYLFVALGASQGLYRASKCQGVCKIVTFGERPAEIPGEIIEGLRGMCNGDGLVEMPEEEKQLRKRLQTGDRIVLQYGGSTGHQGVVMIDSGQVIRLEIEGKRVTALPEQVSPSRAAR